MKRSHHRSETQSLLKILRKELPGAAIRTTLISGHPGESESDHEELKKFISEFRFDRLGVFAYSHEEGTYSYNNYSDDLTDEEKETRVSELMEIQQNISAELNRTKIGSILKVIIDRKEGEFFIGRSEFDSPEVDQEILIPSEYKVKPGEFYNIQINQSADFDLYGKPV
jgi:ribosomal protein S12 methylthiotransferase